MTSASAAGLSQLARMRERESNALHARSQRFIVESLRGTPPETFDDLAVALASHQAAHIPALARLMKARGVSPNMLRTASQIPAVPCDVFRLARLAVHPAGDDTHVFRTSGTSQGREARGEHGFRTTATCELAARSWGKHMLWPDRDRMQVIVLAPPAHETPDSSLGFMLDRFATLLGGPATFHLRASGNSDAAELDVTSIAEASAHARDASEPTLVCGASFAFVHLLDAVAVRNLNFALPMGSRVMQTGGFKGKSRQVGAVELRRDIARLFSIDEARVVGEYGMTELSSQLYEGTLASTLTSSLASVGGFSQQTRHGLYHAPPWVRVVAVDPVSLEPVPRDEVGLARIEDLANVDSVVAIQTSDRVRVTDQGVELLGRAPGASPRGCSLAIDEILGGAVNGYVA